MGYIQTDPMPLLVMNSERHTANLGIRLELGLERKRRGDEARTMYGANSTTT